MRPLLIMMCQEWSPLKNVQSASKHCLQVLKEKSLKQERQPQEKIRVITFSTVQVLWTLMKIKLSIFKCTGCEVNLLLLGMCFKKHLGLVGSQWSCAELLEEPTR
uniref:Uncharacterized protein n=1 Tax=Opuntia streptacantha TaxID=393608 RepID=A0A7C9EB37_OPUST